MDQRFGNCGMDVSNDAPRRCRSSVLLYITCMHLLRNWVATCVVAWLTQKNQKPATWMDIKHPEQQLNLFFDVFVEFCSLGRSEPKWTSGFILPRWVTNLRREEKNMFQSEPSHFCLFKKCCHNRAKMCCCSGRMWQKTSQVPQKNSCARASHSSQKCDKYDASHFLSQEKVTNVTSLTREVREKIG